MGEKDCQFRGCDFGEGRRVDQGPFGVQLVETRLLGDAGARRVIDES